MTSVPTKKTYQRLHQQRGLPSLQRWEDKAQAARDKAAEVRSGLQIENIIVTFAAELFKVKIMAKPIKETPILFGDDALRFIERMESGQKETDEERETRIADYLLIKSILAWWNLSTGIEFFRTAKSENSARTNP